MAFYKSMSKKYLNNILPINNRLRDTSSLIYEVNSKIGTQISNNFNKIPVLF